LYHGYAKYNNVGLFSREHFLFDISRKLAAPLLYTFFSAPKNEGEYSLPVPFFRKKKEFSFRKDWGGK
jgi:hypothetical protein